MFPFYDDVIAPILKASGAQRILEIGIRRGATTAQLLERLGPGVELHAIDPVPDFDAAELARKFPGRYVVHADTSHTVLPRLPAFDVALIDGDHNWFTVYHELRMLSETSREAGRELPVLILHDVGWPYGRRDLYYDPLRIPSEYRHEYAQRGLHPARRGFVAGTGGINASMYNAVEEGGARNGVMTAVDDFVAAYDEPLRMLVLPIYFGLAIVATEARIAQHPELGRFLDWLASTTGKERLLELSESIRLRGVANQRSVEARGISRFERASARYLGLLRAALVDEGYVDGEAHVQHLATALDAVRTDGVPGDVVDCTNGRGGTAVFTRGYLDVYDLGDRALWLPDRSRQGSVREALARFDLPDSGMRSFDPAMLSCASIESIAVLCIGAGAGVEVATVLEALYDKIATGGFVVIDNAAGTGAGAMDELRRRRAIQASIERSDGRVVSWRKTAARVGAAP